MIVEIKYKRYNIMKKRTRFNFSKPTRITNSLETTLLDTKRMITISLLTILLISINTRYYFLNAESPSTSATGDLINVGHSSTNKTYRPILIGFRCDQSGTLTADGICIVEAKTSVKLTLFGEIFTRETIIAFTSSTYQGIPITNLELATFNNNETTRMHHDNRTSLVAGLDNKTNYRTRFKEINKPGYGSFRQDQTSSSLSSKRGIDCTDSNRMFSHQLKEKEILAPNVAQIDIWLPDLDTFGSTQAYYFCIKQPILEQPSDDERAGAPNQWSSSSLVWVHQGEESWLTLKVEPPILSLANDCLLIAFLLFLSAVTSGLNLGLMSLDMNELAVISSCGDPRERSYARTIAPLRRRGNYLLCSLLLGNVMVNSTLTVILEEMTSGPIAIVTSTLAIVILGEIVPQAFCARQGLAIGAKTIYLTYAFMLLTFPLSYPISRLLDWVLGEEKGNVYDRERLMEFIKITGHHTQLEADEVAIISGALRLKKIKVDQIMTRIEDVFMLPIDCKLDRETIKRIIEKGYSRIPIYEFGDRKQIVALILAKDLALIDPDDRTPIADMLLYCKHPLIFVEDYVTLDVALNEFKTGKSHMAVVRQIYDDGEVDKYYEAIGVVTLEDVIEEVLQTEINDETDTLSDNRRKRRRPNAQVAHLFDDFTLNTSSTSLSSDSAPNSGPAVESGAETLQRASVAKLSDWLSFQWLL